MKREDIYNEVVAMLNDGADYQSITLSSIAKKCKMGKSTIYEYFKSKDDMIFSSLVFYMKKMIKYFSISWDFDSFEEALSFYIKALVITMRANKWLVLPWTFDSYKRYFTEENQAAVKKLLNSAQNVVKAVFESIIRGHQKQEKFKDLDNADLDFLFFGIISIIADTVDTNFNVNGKACENLIKRIYKSINLYLI